MTIENLKTVRCEITGTEVLVKATAKGNPKLPRGWKWRGDQIFSAEAWHNLYALRAVSVPIVSPAIDGNQVEMKAAWKVLDEQLKEAWQLSTETANWAVKRLWSNDVTRAASDAKCPKMPPIYLYGERDWTGWSSSAGAVLRTIEANYRKRRYEIVWTGSAGVPFVRYPYPYPVHNATWNLSREKGGSIVFDCRLPTGRVAVRLRTKDMGKAWRMPMLLHLLANPDLRGEASIMKKHDGTIWVKMVGWFPKTARVQAGELRVRTDSESFLVALIERDERLLVFHADAIKRKIAGHSAALHRWHDDMKFENRKPKKRARKKAEDMQAAARKMADRQKSFIDETCAHIVGHALRRSLAVVKYDDTETKYFASFAWHRLRERLKVVCEREGLGFEWCGAAPKAGSSRKNVTQTESK